MQTVTEFAKPKCFNKNLCVRLCPSTLLLMVGIVRRCSPSQEAEVSAWLPACESVASTSDASVGHCLLSEFTRVNCPEWGYPAPLILNFGPKSIFFNLFLKKTIMFLMVWAENCLSHTAATRRIWLKTPEPLTPYQISKTPFPRLAVRQRCRHPWPPNRVFIHMSLYIICGLLFRTRVRGITSGL